MRTIRIMYKDYQGRRCTQFIETHGEFTCEDVTAKVPAWKKIKPKKPTKADMALARIGKLLGG